MTDRCKGPETTRTMGTNTTTLLSSVIAITALANGDRTPLLATDHTRSDLDSRNFSQTSPFLAIQLTPLEQTNTGTHVQAHGGGIIQVGSTYYWIGEDKTNGSVFRSINCYGSTNLIEWTYVHIHISWYHAVDTNLDRSERCSGSNQAATWVSIASSSARKLFSTRARASMSCGCTSMTANTAKRRLR